MIKTLKHLSFVLKVELIEINSIVENIDKYYREKNIIKLDKNGNPKLDKNDNPKKRIINPSIDKLKVLQKNIHRNILLKIKMPSYAYGAVRGKDNVINAKKHQGKKYKFTTDLKDFFPSITNKDVYEMFLRNQFSHDVSSLLTKLTTYKGHIPQGAPTSSTLANLVFVKTGDQLEEFSKNNNITFTSFVDDLSFSSSEDFKDKIPQILDIIEKNFKISHQKTFYSRNPIITGIIPMNNTIRLPKSFLDKFNDFEFKPKEQQLGLLRYKDKVLKTNRNKKNNNLSPENKKPM